MPAFYVQSESEHVVNVGLVYLLTRLVHFSHRLHCHPQSRCRSHSTLESITLLAASFPRLEDL